MKDLEVDRHPSVEFSYNLGVYGMSELSIHGIRTQRVKISESI